MNSNDPPRGGFSRGTGGIGPALKARIKDAYGLALRNASEDDSALWKMIAAKNANLHERLLLESSDLAELDDPGSGYLLYGFDNLFLDFTSSIKNNESSQSAICAAFVNELVKLDEAIGGTRVWNPEGGSLYPGKDRPVAPDVESMLDRIEDTAGVELDFPNPFPNEFGLETSRGIISQRALHAIYQALCLRDLSRRYGGRILEIGAGLGRTAYYALKFGIRQYTIVDLPLTNVAQSAFLGSCLGDSQISLYGEPDVTDGVRIFPGGWLSDSVEKFDIFLNADSLTEMSFATASHYADEFKSRGKVFLSINHEANVDRVVDIDVLRRARTSRHPYWLRAGYVEEIFESEAMTG